MGAIKHGFINKRRYARLLDEPDTLGLAGLMKIWHIRTFSMTRRLKVYLYVYMCEQHRALVRQQRVHEVSLYSASWRKAHLGICLNSVFDAATVWLLIPVFFDCLTTVRST